MVETTQTIEEPKNFSLTIKMNAKREFYGEYTVKADDFNDLEEKAEQATQLLLGITGL